MTVCSTSWSRCAVAAVDHRRHDGAGLRGRKRALLSGSQPFAHGRDRVWRPPATTTVEVIQEFAHVRARRRGRADARRLAIAYADLLAPLATTTERHLRTGLDWWDRHKAIGDFDAVLAAVAQDLGATALVSSDRAFARLTEVTHVLPDGPGLAALFA